MKKYNKKHGFTLVELLVVIAILAILATVSVVGYTAFIERAHKSNALSEANQIREIFRAAVLSGDTYYLTASKESGAITITSSDHETGNLNGVSTLIYLAKSGAKIKVGTSTTETDPTAANDDLSEILTDGKYIEIAQNATAKLTYHYVNGNYSYSVEIDLANLDDELNA